MFGIGLQEMFIILIIALVVLGPDKLPDLARAIGKGIGEFRRATDEIKKSINSDDELRELKTSLSQAKNEMTELVRRETSGIDADAITRAFTDDQVPADQTTEQGAQNGIEAGPAAESGTAQAVAAADVTEPGEATGKGEEPSAVLPEKDKPST